MTDRQDTAKTYDAVADEYVAHIYGELRDKPLDRELLDRFADAVRGAGPVCDIGCGPGQVARYLHDRGVEMSGIDLAFHIGNETIHRDEWWGHAVSVDYLLFTTEEMTGYLRQAGFEVESTRERDPYPDVEHPSRRSYIVARNPAPAR